MYLYIGDKASVKSIQGNIITGNVTAILENTVIIFCGASNQVVLKTELIKQGYKFNTAEKRSKTIKFSTK